MAWPAMERRGQCNLCAGAASTCISRDALNLQKHYLQRSTADVVFHIEVLLYKGLAFKEIRCYKFLPFGSKYLSQVPNMYF